MTNPTVEEFDRLEALEMGKVVAQRRAIIEEGKAHALQEARRVAAIAEHEVALYQDELRVKHGARPFHVIGRRPDGLCWGTVVQSQNGGSRFVPAADDGPTAEAATSTITDTKEAQG